MIKPKIDLKKWRSYLLPGIAMAIAVASLAGNVVLYQFGNRHFRLHNQVRLDPMQLGYYSNDAKLSSLEPRVVFLGDSRIEMWPMKKYLPGVAFINRGISFQTTAQILGRFEKHVAPLAPSVVVIQMGVNDLKNIAVFPEQKKAIIARCKQNIAEVLRHAKSIGALVIVTTVFPLGDVPLSRKLFWSDEVARSIVDVNRFILSLAGDGVTVINSYDILADAAGTCKKEYQFDLLHINPAGYKKLSEALVTQLKPILQKR